METNDAMRCVMSVAMRTRVTRALEETVRLHAKEMCYSASLRKQDRLESYAQHMARLENMLATNEFESQG
jgi:hypothetical protein